MVADAASRPVRRERAIPYEGRLLLTVVLLAAYVYGHRIPLPLVELDETLSYGALLSILALGTNPLFTGFLLAELFSLMTSPGRRWRQNGAAGRATINRVALIASLVLAAFQGLGIAQRLELMTAPSGLPLVGSPGTLFVLLTVLTLAAATAGVFVLGQALSTYGIGNGFALLFLVNAGWSTWSAAVARWKYFNSSPLQGLGLLLILGLVLLLVRFIRGAEDDWLPAFPQGVVPVSLAVLATPMLWAWIAIRVLHINTSNLALLVATVIAVPLISWVTFHLFSSRPRLEASLTDAEDFLTGLAEGLRRRALPAGLLLTLGAAAFLIWNDRWSQTMAASFTFVNVVYLVAIGLDLWDQFRFQRGHGETALLIQLDNVHFSYRLEERLQEEGIDALARGHQLRSLFFFFGALYKIDMLVPVDRLGQAREILAELETAREIRAF
jgi:hypothetical protein